MAPLKVHGPVRMRSMQTGITKWKEGSFEIVEKDNKVSLVVHYNVGGIPKTFQVGAAGPGPSRLSGVAAPSSSFLSAVPRCGPALNYSGVALRHRLDERGRAAGAELRLTCWLYWNAFPFCHGACAAWRCGDVESHSSFAFDEDLRHLATCRSANPQT